MAIGSGWTRRCPIVIDHTKVPGDLSNFPVLFNVDNLPSEMLDLDGSYPCNSTDGRDIRFSSDQAGNTELAVEVVGVSLNNNPALSRIEIHVKIPSLSSSVDTTVYVWYNNTSATMPSRTSTYGSDNVWDADYRFVVHVSGSLNDSTSYALTGTNHSSGESSTIYKLGYSSRTFATASSQYIDYGNQNNINGDVNITLESVVRITSAPDTYNYIAGRGENYKIQCNDVRIEFATFNTSWDSMVSDDPITNGNWYHWCGRRTASTDTNEAYRDGSLQTNTAATSQIRNEVTCSLQIGQNNGGGYYLDGYVDEFRISTSARTGNWITTGYNSLMSPSTFAVEGTPESIARAIITQVIWLM